ncbi:uncharacterized protein LOC143905375 [Temnothorax americanus]|uniref:uncharacterized protein LOC143905375 n=1 Tax=Temnothorax americanus TaxID=1964332 RepID=UPI0040678B3B
MEAISARLLHDTLDQSVPKPHSHVKDSWSFVDMIGGVGIEDDDVLVSLDVTALFTNIPKDLVIKAIEKRWNHIAEKTKLSLSQFTHAIDLVLSSTSFCFNGEFYEPIFGSPMGSPLSPILADLVMDDLETHCLQSLSFVISFYCRYVDDIFAVVPKSKIDELLTTFNNYHTRLKFTYEMETDSALNFFDTTVIREKNALITNWYRKPTFSGRYINYFSNHPFKYKVNIIRNLVDRATLLSNARFHSNNISIVRNILLNNCFPIDVVNKYINVRRAELLKKFNNPCGASTDRQVRRDPVSSITIPYVEGLSANVERTMRGVKFKTLLTIPKKLDCIIRKGKDRLQPYKQTELVYEIDCVNCDSCYIGQTKRHLETRIKEHRSDVKKHFDNHSVVTKHRLSQNHDFDWQNPKILYKEKHFRKREISEMFFIKKSKHTVNLQKDTENLPAIYDRIIEAV